MNLRDFIAATLMSGAWLSLHEFLGVTPTSFDVIIGALIGVLIARESLYEFS